MDLFIDRDQLGRGLARVQGIIERRSTHPLLSHVLMDAREERLRITATDTEVAYIGDLAANIEKGGDIAVDAANLFQIVRALPEPTVQLTKKDKRLEIRSGRAQFKLPGREAEDYPPLPPFEARGGAQMTEGALRRLVEQTSFAVATDDVRYGLNGAHLEEAEVEGQAHLRIVATDGHRLSSAQSPFTGELALTPRMLVPRKALSVIRKLLEGDEDQVELGFGDGAIRLTRPDETFWFRLLDGEFPDYNAVVPKEHKHRALIRREALVATLKRVSILVLDRARAVRFAFGESELEIEVHNVDRGDVRETVPIELEGDPVDVGFNVRYLAEVLSVMKGEYVALELAHQLAPCLVRDPDEEGAFFVIMPMRLD